MLITEKLLKFLIRRLLTEQDFTSFLNQYSGQQSGGYDDDNDPVMRVLGQVQQQQQQGNQQVAQQVQQAKQQQETNLQDTLRVNFPFLQKRIQGLTSLQQLQKLGQGSQGVAYAIDGERVLKVTRDASEARSSNSLRGKKLKSVSNIYDVFKFPGTNAFYGIVLEKIIPLPQWPDDKFKHSIEAVSDDLQLKNLLQKHGGNWSQVWPEMLQMIHRDPMLNKQEEGLKQAFDALQTAAVDLQQAGIKNYFDIHSDNIGKRANGSLVLFDIGFSGEGGEEPGVLSERKNRSWGKVLF